jgi:hypothetical protein
LAGGEDQTDMVELGWSIVWCLKVNIWKRRLFLGCSMGLWASWVGVVVPA